jgi:small subunit ribosomal protein S4
MARTGPRLEAVRRLGTPLRGLTRKSADRRPYPPGAHGATTGRRCTSSTRGSASGRALSLAAAPCILGAEA